MSLTKTIKNLCKNHMVILTVVAAMVLIYFVNSYSAQKGLVLSGMASGSSSSVGASNSRSSPSLAGSASPAAPLGQNSGPAGASGVSTEMHGLPPNCAKQPVVDPKQLLPKDNNNQFSKMNPMGAGDVANVSLMNPTHLIGINTVGQSLRNANLQLRSEPANPQLNVGPWNTSTIGPDLSRRPLEIGQGSN